MEHLLGSGQIITVIGDEPNMDEILNAFRAHGTRLVFMCPFCLKDHPDGGPFVLIGGEADDGEPVKHVFGWFRDIFQHCREHHVEHCEMKMTVTYEPFP